MARKIAVQVFTVGELHLESVTDFNYLGEILPSTDDDLVPWRPTVHWLPCNGILGCPGEITQPK